MGRRDGSTVGLNMEVIKLSGTMKIIKMRKPIDIEWQKVVFANELSLCDYCSEELWCPIHNTHYDECECIGPMEDDVEYQEIDGTLYARRL